VLSACKPAAIQTNTAATPATPPLTAAANEQTSAPTGQETVEPEGSPVVETPTQLSLSQADHGKTIQLPLGQRFALQLGDAATWEVAISDPDILSRVIGSPAAQGVQGIYEAKSPGRTTLTATSGQGGEGLRVTIEVPAGAPLSTAPAQGASEPLSLNSVHMITPFEGWALGSSSALIAAPNDGPQPLGIFRTTDGGHSWMEVTPPSLNRAAMVSAYFASFQKGWLASPGRDGDGTSGSIVVYSTEDGGVAWQVSPPMIPSAGGDNTEGVPLGLTFVDDQHGWLLVRSGVDTGSESINIYRTMDGGQSWNLAGGDSSSSLPHGCTITGLTFLDNQAGWITGSCGGGRLFFYITKDGGNTWAPDNLLAPGRYPADLFSQCRCSVLPPQFPDSQYGVLPVAIAENDAASDFSAFLYLSQDGGQSWLPYTLPVNTLTLPPVFVDAQHGWISDGKAIYISRDGGQSWTWISKLPAGVALGGLNFMTPQTGFITDGLQLYATQDGGVTWTGWQPVTKTDG
jgi:photosystem II stability/assembly factor-like uncharacterized protein